eukprot:gene21585-28583_t
MPGSAEVLSLYRSFLRSGAHFPNYNIRENWILLLLDASQYSFSCSRTIEGTKSAVSHDPPVSYKHSWSPVVSLVSP